MTIPYAKADGQLVPPFGIKENLRAKGAELRIINGSVGIKVLRMRIVVKQVGPQSQEINHIPESPIGITQRQLIVGREFPHLVEVFG